MKSVRFTFKLRWDPAKPGDFAVALHHQLGLDLKAPSRAMEFLVVDSGRPRTGPAQRPLRSG